MKQYETKIKWLGKDSRDLKHNQVINFMINENETVDGRKYITVFYQVTKQHDKQYLWDKTIIYKHKDYFSLAELAKDWELVSVKHEN